MDFREYMVEKEARDCYTIKRGPFDVELNALIAERDRQIQEISDRYNNLIGQKMQTANEICGSRPECHHEIQVMMRIIAIPASLEFPHGALKEYHCCLNCGMEIKDMLMMKPYIGVVRPVDSSEVPVILQAMRAKVGELFQENPDMDMWDVKKALHEFVNGELEQNQARK